MSEEYPVINIEPEPEVVETSLALNVPLFLRKLWKMVNDESAKDIISWNESGDGFIIHDQLQFISHLLPQYFKHNHMASFVRQLNFYDFHKVANTDKEEIQFAHNYFLKDLPQTLAFIKRKCVQKTRHNSENLNQIFDNIKDLKGKHEVVSTELQRMQQDNATLWEELNALRVKHSKQCKIINKLIHFLISYMQSRSMTAKRTRPVTKKGDAKRLRPTPKLLEIDYRKNRPDVWDEDQNLEPEDQYMYTVTEPNDTEFDLIRYENQCPGNQDIRPQNISNMPNFLTGITQPTKGSVEKLLIPSVGSKGSTNSDKSVQGATGQINVSQPGMSHLIESNIPSKNGASRTIPFNFKSNPKEDFGLYIDNAQVKLDTIQDMLNNISPNDLASFCELMQDNFNQEFGMDSSDIAPDQSATEPYKSITDSSESEPVQNVKKEIEEEFKKELAGMEVLSQFQPSTSTVNVEDMLGTSLDTAANTSNNSDDVNNIIEDLILDTNITPENRIMVEKDLEKELAEIVKAVNMPASSLKSTRKRTKLKKENKE